MFFVLLVCAVVASFSAYGLEKDEENGYSPTPAQVPYEAPMPEYSTPYPTTDIPGWYYGTPAPDWSVICAGCDDDSPATKCDYRRCD